MRRAILFARRMRNHKDLADWATQLHTLSTDLTRYRDSAVLSDFERGGWLGCSVNRASWSKTEIRFRECRGEDRRENLDVQPLGA